MITIRRSGGFAGLSDELVALDMSKLGEDARAHVRQTIAKLRQLKDAAEEPVGADMLRYEIEVRDAPNQTDRLAIVDDGDPGNPQMTALRDLLGALGAHQ